jgi:hypothetical protein
MEYRSTAKAMNAVTLGECLMGRYCVRQITANLLELEDLEDKQRRILPKALP